jgi:TonB-dependent SusC/RagA subfamily outer membrane receptor
MKRNLLLGLVLMFTFGATWAQSTVTGSVTGAEDGTPIPGVNVLVKGTSVGTVTDIEGNYQIAVPDDGSVLVFSFIGLVTEEILVGSQSTINMIMSADLTQLEEIIVTAYGTSTVKDFTGSATAINSKDIELRQVTNPIAAIEGNSTGVQFITPSGAPGESPEIVIRGVGTLNGVTSPLYIVDGVQFDGSLTLINQDDIESMTILKDAASTSLYGSRAANGVVIITTKSGRKGQGTKVNYSGQYGWMSQAIGQYEATNPQQYYEVMWEAYKNSLDVADPAAEASATIKNRLGYNPFGNTGILMINKPLYSYYQS